MMKLCMTWYFLKKNVVRKKGSDLKELREEAISYIEMEEQDKEHVEIGRSVSE